MLAYIFMNWYHWDRGKHILESYKGGWVGVPKSWRSQRAEIVIRTSLSQLRTSLFIIDILLKKIAVFILLKLRMCMLMNQLHFTRETHTKQTIRILAFLHSDLCWKQIKAEPCSSSKNWWPSFNFYTGMDL